MDKRPQIIKMFVGGSFSSGKTSFIKSISEIGAVKTEYKTKLEDLADTPTISVDFGRLTIEPNLVTYFLGQPGARRVDTVARAMSEIGQETNIMAFVVVLDSSRSHSFKEIMRVLEGIESNFPSSPYIVAANKQDHKDAWSVEDMRIILKIPPEVKMIPCVATDKESVKSVLLALCDEMLARLDLDNEG